MGRGREGRGGEREGGGGEREGPRAAALTRVKQRGNDSNNEGPLLSKS